MTIDGKAVQLSADDCRFLAECLHAGLSHRGHRFERNHRSTAGVAFRIAGGETLRPLPSGVSAFTRRTPTTGAAAPARAGHTLTDC